MMMTLMGLIKMQMEIRNKKKRKKILLDRLKHLYFKNKSSNNQDRTKLKRLKQKRKEKKESYKEN